MTEIEIVPCLADNYAYLVKSGGAVAVVDPSEAAPVAAALLPNGNLIVANTQGGNKLVELTPAGKVLAIKAVDKSATPHVFGLASAGTSDTNTVVFFTTTEDSTVHELEP